MASGRIPLLALPLLLMAAPSRPEPGFVCAGAISTDSVDHLMGVAAKPAAALQAGTRNAVVVFARFRGESDGGMSVPSWSADIFDPDLPGSFSHFYDTMSFGQLRVRGEVASLWYESRHEASFYVATASAEAGMYGQFSQEILRRADGDIDYSRFDNDGPDGVPNSGDDDGVVDAILIATRTVPTGFILGAATGVGHLGWDEPLVTNDMGASGVPIEIHPNQGTIQRGRSFSEAVGSMCHEYGHVLGLPDLYNTENLDTPGAPPQDDSAGIGAWGLMGWGAMGWHGDDGPTSFCAWSRMRLGWAQVEDAGSEEETLQLADVGLSGLVYRVLFAAHEYFLLEYRTRESSHYDRMIPGEGLLIWHVRRGWVTEGESNRWFVDLECADGRWLEAGYPLGQTRAPQEGGDNLDFWSHDEGYREAHAGNLGDATDPFDGVRFRSFTPETNPAAVSARGGWSVRVEGIEARGSEMWARVRTTPLLLALENITTHDQSADGIAVSGEGVSIRYAVVNQGGLRAEDVTVAVHTDDPLVEIVNQSTAYSSLNSGSRTLGGGSRGFPAIAFADQFVGTHEAEVILLTHAKGVLVNEHRLTITGVSAQQSVRRVTVEDSAGNGDGQVQASEIFSLSLSLEVERPELLGAFALSLRPVTPMVEPLAGTGLSLHPRDDEARIARSREFLAMSGAEPGQSLDFELGVRSAYASWMDTLTVEVAVGPDETAPRVLALHTRPVPQGVRVVLPESRFIEGDSVLSARALVLAYTDSSQVASVPLQWRDHRYEGVWHTQDRGTFLIQTIGLSKVVPRNHKI